MNAIQRDKKIDNMEERLRNMDDSIRSSNRHLVGIIKREERN